MALPRRKFRFTQCIGYFALALAAMSSATDTLKAATTERVISDFHTGLAIFGYDPVSYFTNEQPVMGRPDIELQGPDAIWRFHNDGNKAAFAAHPEVYRPRYGGYDPIALARGVAVAGNPLLWLVVGERLFL